MCKLIGGLSALILPIISALVTTIMSKMLWRDKWSVCVMAGAQLVCSAETAALGKLSASNFKGGVVVFDDTVDMAQQARFAFEFCAIESCGKCTPCRIGSTRGAETMDRVIAGDGEAVNLVRDLCGVMQDGSLCALGGLTHMPVLSALDNFPNHFPGAARDAAE